jgi:hypothetical protein
MNGYLVSAIVVVAIGLMVWFLILLRADAVPILAAGIPSLLAVVGVDRFATAWVQRRQ